MIWTPCRRKFHYQVPQTLYVPFVISSNCLSFYTDYIAVGNVGFEWVQSYDLKDWDRLRRILAPAVTSDFRGIKGLETVFEDLTPDAYVAILSSPGVLGNPLLKSQHLIGSKKYELLEDGRIRVHNQIRVAHQLYNDDELTAVRNKGHGHGVAIHTYEKVEGEWKLAITASTSEWSEFDLAGLLSGKESSVPL